MDLAALPVKRVQPGIMSPCTRQRLAGGTSVAMTWPAELVDTLPCLLQTDLSFDQVPTPLYTLERVDSVTYMGGYIKFWQDVWP